MEVTWVEFERHQFEINMLTTGLVLYSRIVSLPHLKNFLKTSKMTFKLGIISLA
jgi:hypothetical protein